MSQAPAFANGTPPSAAGRAWLRRVLAACFLGAGAYACLAVGSDLAARADEPAATQDGASAPQQEAPPPDDPATTPTSTSITTGDATASASATSAAAPTTGSPDSAEKPSAQDEPATDGTADDAAAAGERAPAQGLTATAIATSTTTSTVASTATSTSASASTSTATSTVASTVSTTVSGTTTVTTTTSSVAVARRSGTAQDETVPAALTQGCTTVGAPDDTTSSCLAEAQRAADPVTGTIAGPMTVLALDCAPLPVTYAGDDDARWTGPAGESDAPDYRATGQSAVPATAADPAIAPTPGDVPPPPPDLPADTSPLALGGAGSCGTGSGAGSPRGPGGPGAAVLTTSPTLFVASGDAARAMPAAGSPSLRANDPATRPD